MTFVIPLVVTATIYVRYLGQYLDSMKLILCFTKSWLNDDMNNIQLAGYTLYRQDGTVASDKTRGGGLYIFVNNSWCTISKEVSMVCSSEVVSHDKL